MPIDTYPPQALVPSSTQLGYAEVTADQTGLSSTITDLTGLSVTVFIPAGRRIRITAFAHISSNTAASVAALRINDGANQLTSALNTLPNVGQYERITAQAVVSPSAGMHTFLLRGDVSAGTGIATATTARPNFILVEDITGGTSGPGPISLGYAEVVADQAGITTTNVDLTGLAVTINVPAGRTIKITAHVYTHNTSAGAQDVIRINEGATGLMSSALVAGAVSTIEKQIIQRVLTPTAGVHTYKLTADTNTGSMTAAANSSRPNWLLVEDITGTPSPAGIMPTSQTLAYAQVTANQGSITAGNPGTDLTGLSVTITVPDGRRLRISGRCAGQKTTVGQANLRLFEGGSVLAEDFQQYDTVGGNYQHNIHYIITPSAGSHTYKLTFGTDSAGTLTMLAAPNYPAYILVEDITGGAPAVPPVNVPVGVLAMAFSTTAQTITPTATVDLTGLSVNVVVPAGRTLRLHAHVPLLMNDAGRALGSFLEGATELGRWIDSQLGSNYFSAESSIIISPSAGSHTYKLAAAKLSGAATMVTQAGSWNPAMFWVEDITATPAPPVGAPSSTLGYAEAVVNQGSITSEVDLTGLFVTVTVPAGRRLRISGKTMFGSTVAGDRIEFYVHEDGVQIQDSPITVSSTLLEEDNVSVIRSPSAGTHTYKLRASRGGGTGTITMYAGATYPSFILVEDITGVSMPPYTVAIQPTSQTLAYAEILADTAAISASADVSGLAMTITVPAGRRIRLRGHGLMWGDTNAAGARLMIFEGATMLQLADTDMEGSRQEALDVEVVLSPSAGTHTYKMMYSRWSGAGTVKVLANATYPAYFLAEDITGGSPVADPVSVPVGQLAYAQGVVAVGPFTAATQILSANVVVPSGRQLEITVQTHFTRSVVDGTIEWVLQDNGATIGVFDGQPRIAAQTHSFKNALVVSPSAGSHTYTVLAYLVTGTGTVTLIGSATQPNFLLIEDITPTPAPANTAPSSTLGYAEITANVTGLGNPATAIPGLSATVTVPAGRRIRVSARGIIGSSTTTDQMNLKIYEGGTQLTEGPIQATIAGRGYAISAELVTSPSAGTHTYTVRAGADTGTPAVTLYAGPTDPAYLLVEDITAASVPVYNPAVQGFGAGGGAITDLAISSASTWQNWGSAVTIPNPATKVTVIAFLTGYAFDFVDANGTFSQSRVRISFDGGSSFTDGQQVGATEGQTPNFINRAGVGNSFIRAGIPTGTIVIQAQGNGATTNVNFSGGTLTYIMVPV